MLINISQATPKVHSSRYMNVVKTVIGIWLRENVTELSMRIEGPLNQNCRNFDRMAANG